MRSRPPRHRRRLPTPRTSCLGTNRQDKPPAPSPEPSGPSGAGADPGWRRRPYPCSRSSPECRSAGGTVTDFEPPHDTNSVDPANHVVRPPNADEGAPLDGHSEVREHSRRSSEFDVCASLSRKGSPVRFLIPTPPTPLSPLPDGRGAAGDCMAVGGDDGLESHGLVGTAPRNPARRPPPLSVLHPLLGGLLPLCLRPIDRSTAGSSSARADEVGHRPLLARAPLQWCGADDSIADRPRPGHGRPPRRHDIPAHATRGPAVSLPCGSPLPRPARLPRRAAGAGSSHLISSSLVDRPVRRRALSEARRCGGRHRCHPSESPAVFHHGQWPAGANARGSAPRPRWELVRS